MGALFFREPRLAALLALTLIAAGASAMLAIGRQEDPTITNLFATVTTPFPGAEPTRVEALVTDPLEAALQEVSEVALVTSSSAAGVSILQLELADTLSDDGIDTAWAEIRAALDAVRPKLPAGAGAPEFANDSSGAWSLIGALTATVPGGAVADPAMLARYADVLAGDLRRVPGTDEVERFGAPDEEVLVEVTAERLASLGLSSADVRRAIEGADAKVRAGRVRGATRDLVIEVAGELETLERVRAVPLAGGDGRVARVGDVARVARSVRAPAAELAISDGVPAILVAARLAENLQIDAWIEDVRAELERFVGDLPVGIEYRTVFDQSVYTAERLTGVGSNMAIGVGLVIAVLLVTLGLRAALIVAIVLPLVSLAAIATMNLIGLPIQQMSLTGLIVALGLLVDAAIVVTAEIGKRLRAGMARADAVGESVNRLFAPLLGSTVTTALSFAPLALLPGAAGDFVGSIAIAVIVMLLWSFVVALTVTAPLAGYVLPARGTPERGGRVGRGIARAFRGTIGWTLRHRAAAIALAAALPVTGFAAMGNLVQQFFPGVERDQFHLSVELAEGASIDATRAAVERVDAELRAADGVEQVSWTIGRSAPAFYYNLVGDRDRAPEYAQALVRSASPEATAALVPELQRTLADLVPEARVIVRDLVQGPPVSAPVELRLTGPDLDVLAELGERHREVLARADGVVAARATLEGGAPKLELDVDETAARLAGLALTDVAARLDEALEGGTGGSIVDGDEELTVRVRVGQSRRADLQGIEDLPLALPDASGVGDGDAAPGAFDALPLSAIASATLVPSSSAIARRDRERVNTVQGFIGHGLLPAQALDEVRGLLDEARIELPPGYRLEFGGDAGDRDDTVNDLLASLGIVVTLSIGSVVLSLRSFRLAGVTLLVAGLSAGLSFLSLAVFDHPFGINALIGVIGSIGVSINAALILLSGLAGNERAARGDVGAMVDVVAGSGRHIASTTLTTFGGFLPLILGGGAFWPPFAMAIAGGVLLSTVVSFGFVPPMFALVRRRAERAPRAGRASFSTPDTAPTGAIVSFGPSLGVFTRAAIERLVGDAADGPVVEDGGDENQALLGVGVFWRPAPDG